MSTRAILTLVVAGLFVVTLGCAGGGEAKMDTDADEGMAMIVCPLSGEEVDPATAPSAEYNGETYYFCCEKCEGKFKADPAKYAEE